MKILLSPAKSLDFDKQIPTDKSTEILFEKDTEQLVKSLRNKSTKKLMDLMSISENLGKLNYDRYQSIDFPVSKSEAAKPALFVFTGDVYQGLEADDFSATEIERAQKSIRILSGLFGILRPLDKMQAYRLEMGTSLSTRRGKNLYDFWGDKLTKQLNAELKEVEHPLVLNLASNEYAKAIQFKKLKATTITATFKEMHQGKLKFISFNAKKARGLLARYVIKNGIEQAEELKNFNYDGYAFQADGSTPENLLFTR